MGAKGLLKRASALAGIVAFAAAGPVEARNIVIANDDGLTGNVKALYDALKAEGHDVIVALPCSQQSGMGGAIKILRPLGPIQANCVADAAVVGDPGAGQMTRKGLGSDFYYVDGTPVMALLYGLDVVATERWGQSPDLVISGPNIGLNTGNIVVSSGTVSNAQYAMIRGIPAIALSAGDETAGGPELENPLSAVVAKRALELLRKLEASAGNGPLLSSGLGLNVNFPDRLEMADWKLSQIGDFMHYEFRFVTDLPRAMGIGVSPEQPAQPGLLVTRSTAEPRSDQLDDEAAVARNKISVSVMQVAYDVSDRERKLISEKLEGLVDP